MNPTLPQFKAWSKTNAPVAKAVLMARVFADMERERVDAYIRPLFDSYTFQYCGDLAAKTGLSGPVPSPDKLYLCDDPLVRAFYEDCDKLHREHGFNGPRGHCPALTAEHMAILAENALIKQAQELTGIKPGTVYGENRAKYLELLIAACVKAEKAAA